MPSEARGEQRRSACCRRVRAQSRRGGGWGGRGAVTSGVAKAEVVEGRRREGVVKGAKPLFLP